MPYSSFMLQRADLGTCMNILDCNLMWEGKVSCCNDKILDWHYLHMTELVVKAQADVFGRPS